MQRKRLGIAISLASKVIPQGYNHQQIVDYLATENVNSNLNLIEAFITISIKKHDASLKEFIANKASERVEK